MNIPCKTVINKCLCLNGSPLALFSAEQPDQQFFVGRGFTGVNPPLGFNWGVTACQTYATSTASQAAADLMATAEGVECVTSTFANPAGGAVSTYPSMAQTATSTCPDGLVFSYTVPAGAFVSSSSQLDANTQAMTYAQQQASAHMLCLSSLPGTPYCVNAAMDQAITATGAFLAVSPATDKWSVSGTLPPGTSLQSTAVTGGVNYITGSPTTPGVYTFTISVTDPTGDTMSKQYSMTIAGIVNDLPGGTEGMAYLESFTTVGISSPTFALAPGSMMPAGLALTSAGAITGTPTGYGNYAFSVITTDGVTGLACTSNLTLNVKQSCTQPAIYITGSTLQDDTFVWLAYRPAGPSLAVTNNLSQSPYSSIYGYLCSLAGVAGSPIHIYAGGNDTPQMLGYDAKADLFLLYTPGLGTFTLNPTTLAGNIGNPIGLSPADFAAYVQDIQYNSSTMLSYINGQNCVFVVNTSGNAQVGVTPQNGVNIAFCGSISFDLTNGYLYIGWNNLASGNRVAQVNRYTLSGNNITFNQSFALNNGPGGCAIASSIFCPDTGLIYCSYNKLNLAYVPLPFIGVYTTSGTLVAEYQISGDTLTFGAYHDSTPPKLGCYDSVGHRIFLCFDNTVQVVCTFSNQLMNPLSLKASNGVAVNGVFYAIDSSGTDSILKAYK